MSSNNIKQTIFNLLTDSKNTIYVQWSIKTINFTKINDKEFLYENIGYQYLYLVVRIECWKLSHLIHKVITIYS